MRIDYKKIIILGFVFFALNMTWSIYNTFVPIFLRRFIESNTVIGFIMTLDSYAGLFIMPVFGTLSDKAKIKYGKRMPFLLLGMPAALVLISAIPMHWSMFSLIAFIISLNIIMACFRPSATSLMPDLTLKPLWSKANGIIYFMGGIGAVTAYYLGAYLYPINSAYPFYISSVLIFISLLLLYIQIKEKRDCIKFQDTIDLDDDIDGEEQYEEEGDKAKNTIFILAAIFFLFLSFNGMESFFSIYGKYYLGIEEIVTARIMTLFSFSMVIFAVPAGMIASKIGKKKTIIIGLMAMVLLFVSLIFLNSPKTISILFVMAGICWALININIYPIVADMAAYSSIGRFTGYYYLFSSAAAIFSPPLLGKLIDFMGYEIFFIYISIGFAAALLFMLLTKLPGKCNTKNFLYDEDISA